MTRDDEIASALKKLTSTAKVKRRSLHPSFKIELENYAHHKYIRDLPAKDLEAVIAGLGETAIARSAGDEEVGAGDVRAAILELCTNPFSDCSDAAVSVLRELNLHDSANRLKELRTSGVKSRLMRKFRS